MQYTEYTLYNKAVEKAAKDLNINEKLVDKVYRAYCKLIVDKIASLPLKEELTKEEFNKLQTSVNLPSLGKIYCGWKNYIGQKQRVKYVQKAKENKVAKH